jgi:hypothetical protein
MSTMQSPLSTPLDRIHARCPRCHVKCISSNLTAPSSPPCPCCTLSRTRSLALSRRPRLAIAAPVWQCVFSSPQKLVPHALSFPVARRHSPALPATSPSPRTRWLSSTRLTALALPTLGRGEGLWGAFSVRCISSAAVVPLFSCSRWLHRRSYYLLFSLYRNFINWFFFHTNICTSLHGYIPFSQS